MEICSQHMVVFCQNIYRDIVKKPVMEAQAIPSKGGKGLLKAVNAL